MNTKVSMPMLSLKEDDPILKIFPGDLVYVKLFRRWRDGPFEAVQATFIAVKVKGSSTWCHLNHCVNMPTSRKI